MRVDLAHVYIEAPPIGDLSRQRKGIKGTMPRIHETDGLQTVIVLSSCYMLNNAIPASVRHTLWAQWKTIVSEMKHFVETRKSVLRFLEST